MVSAQYASASSLARLLPRDIEERYTSTPPVTSSILVMNSDLFVAACRSTEFSTRARVSSLSSSDSFPEPVLICRIAS